MIKNFFCFRQKPPFFDSASDGGIQGGAVYSLNGVSGSDAIYAMGDFTSCHNNTNQVKVANLNRLDSRIYPLSNLCNSCNGTIRDSHVTSSYAIVVGSFTSIKGVTQNRMAKITLSTGALDATFRDSGGTKSNGYIYKILYDDNGGGTFIGGTFTSVGGVTSRYIAKIFSNSACDAAFVSTTGPNAVVYAICPDYSIQSPKYIFIAGDFTTYNGTTRPRLARINADNGGLSGSLNGQALFNGSVRYLFYNQSNTSLYACGYFTKYNNVDRTYLVKFGGAGGIDNTFDISSKISGQNTPGVLTFCFNGNSMYIGGRFDTYNGVTRISVAKLNATTGELDTNFNVGLISNTDTVHKVFISDGYLYIAGSFSVANNDVSVSNIIKVELNSGVIR